MIEEEDDIFKKNSMWWNLSKTCRLGRHGDSGRIT